MWMLQTCRGHLQCSTCNRSPKACIAMSRVADKKVLCEAQHKAHLTSNVQSWPAVMMLAMPAQAPDEIWGLPLQPAEAAANMLIARVGFDLLRSPAFQTAASAYVQKKLDQFRLPPYIGPLKARPLHFTAVFPARGAFLRAASGRAYHSI